MLKTGLKIVLGLVVVKYLVDNINKQAVKIEMPKINDNRLAGYKSEIDQQISQLHSIINEVRKNGE